jgi:hypothetical protein
MYYRRRRIYEQNCHRNPEIWKGVGLLLDALGPRGTSNDETDNDSKHANPDSCFKTVRRADIGFLSSAIAEIWASVESYPSSTHPSHGNRSFKWIAKAKSINKKRTPLLGLPINIYDPTWLQGTPPHFWKCIKAEVPLPIIVGYYILSAARTHLQCIGTL